mgnify:CR=1 FL=1|jgi:hypothetical protein
MSTTNQMGEFITLDEAAQMTARYRATIQPGETIAVAVSTDVVNRLLSQENCKGLRFYFAVDAVASKTLVAVGIDQNGNDITSGLIADNFGKCPSICSIENSLNS